MSNELSKTLIDSLQPRTQDYVVWDRRIVGFGIKVTPKGKKIFVLKYRNKNQRQRKYTIGSYGMITLQQARQIAAEKMLEIFNRIDPMAEIDKAKAAITMAEFCDRYQVDYANIHKKASSAREDAHMIRKHLKPNLGHLMLRDITRIEIAELHKKLSGTPYHANRIRSLLSKMFGLAEEWGLREENTNPTRHVKKYKEYFRTRYLSHQEMQNLANVLKELERDVTHVALIRLLLLTGARISEIQGAKWEWIDFQQRLLILPDSKTGRRVIFLTKPVIELLEKLPRFENHPYILIGRSIGKSIGSPNFCWDKIREKAGLVDFRIHDLRHSYATICNQLELSEGTIGSLLGHRSKTTVTQRYIHHVDGFVREAAEKVAVHIEKMLLLKPNEASHDEKIREIAYA